MEAPAAIDRTNNALFGTKKLISNKGAVRPAAVIIATVAEPCRRRIIAAAKKANNSKGKPSLANAVAIIFPAAVLINICLNAPPAPVNNTIIPAGAIERLASSNNFLAEKP